MRPHGEVYPQARLRPDSDTFRLPFVALLPPPQFKCSQQALWPGTFLANTALELTLSNMALGCTLMEKHMNTIQTISTAFTSGGIWMWSILIVQIASIVIIAERVFYLYFSRTDNQKKLVGQFEKDIKKGQLENALQRAQNMGSYQPIARAVRAGAQAAIDLGGKDEIQARMDEVLLNEHANLEKRTGFLAMLGNVGTLLGLLGTIVGLIQAFGGATNVDPIEKANILTQGVALAMNTTAYGLIMAIPALVLYAVLQNRANALAEDLDQASLRAFNWLSYSYENSAARKTAGR